MSEAVVVLTPTGASRQEVGSGIGRTPRSFGGLLEKLKVLEDLGSDNHKEGLVAGHHGPAATDEMTDHASEEGIFGEHFVNMSVAGFW